MLGAGVPVDDLAAVARLGPGLVGLSATMRAGQALQRAVEALPPATAPRQGVR